MVGNLFADHIPFGFSKVVIPFIIKPDRTGSYPYYIRNRYMLLKLRQDYSSCKGREPGGLYFFKFSCLKCVIYARGSLIANLFHAGDANLIIMTGQEISVNIPPSLDPVYSNMIQIAYKDDEFTFVFLHQLPQVNQARAKAIVSITPAHAKNLLAVLTKTVADYESKFGTISPPKEAHGAEKVTTLSGYS
jgi:hypothetical protein